MKDIIQLIKKKINENKLYIVTIIGLSMVIIGICGGIINKNHKNDDTEIREVTNNIQFEEVELNIESDGIKFLCPYCKYELCMDYDKSNTMYTSQYVCYQCDFKSCRVMTETNSLFVAKHELDNEIMKYIKQHKNL